MRVGYFYRDYLDADTLGRPRATKCMSRAMVRGGAELVVYCYTPDRRRCGTFVDRGVTVRAFYQTPLLHHRNFFHAPTALQSLLRRNTDAVDVLILSGGFIPENRPVARLLREAGIPYVYEPYEAFDPHTFRGVGRLKKGLYEWGFERQIVDGAAAVRLISQAQQQHLAMRGYRLDSDRLLVAKDGVDRELMQAEAGDASIFAPHTEEAGPDLLFGYIGRLDIYQKGLDILLQGWAAYQQRGGSGTLLIVGPDPTGAATKKLRALCRRLALRGVHLLPPRYGRAKYDFMRQISVLLHPSRHEIIPRVLREALAVGCPVIVTEHTNLHDLVREQQAGFITGLDPHDLAQQLERFRRLEPAERQQMRQRARQAGAVLDYDTIADRYLRDIRACLSHRLSNADPHACSAHPLGKVA